MVLDGNMLHPHLQRCVQSHWSPSCRCCGSTDRTTSSSGPGGTQPRMRIPLKTQNNIHFKIWSRGLQAVEERHDVNILLELKGKQGT